VNVQPLLTGVLLMLGFGFLLANAKLAFDYVLFLKRRRGALLIWRAPKPPHYTSALGLGVALGLLVFAKLVLLQAGVRRIDDVPVLRVLLPDEPDDRPWLLRGRYLGRDRLHPLSRGGGISWREGEHQVTLIVISRLRNLARRLNVPGDKYGAARRLLRDKIGEHAIHFTGTGLDLGAHDERDEA
jgi:hypothetical protein